MGRAIVRATPDRDLYCEWSSNTDSPTVIGNRAEMATWLADYYSPHDYRWRGEAAIADEIERDLARADTKGTSSLVRHPLDYGDGIVSFGGAHQFDRSRLADLLDAYLARGDDEPDPTDEELEAAGIIRPR